ncbi:hypothetical protein GCM10022393_43420 [Aquimarina addita]|uniref:Uncharacterized protein n=1 Tax=Aquimarina addita TaxID=870485 RepID=A0ABP6UY33_9FLAO
MREFNLYEDIKSSIEENLSLIKKYGFNEVQEEQIAYEYHFSIFNDLNEYIDISFEAISSSPIWIKINNIHIEKLLKDEVLMKIDNDLNSLYKENFDLYLKFDDTKYIGNNFENYKKFGRELNNKKLNRAFKILEMKFRYLSQKSNDLNEQIEEPALCSKKISDLKKLMTSDNFINDFKQAKKMILETDKCEIEINSLDELKDVLESLSEQSINNIEWELKK